MAKHFMNPQVGAHFGAGREAEPSDDVQQESGQHFAPHIHLHPVHDEKGRHIKTHVHVMHHDGEDEHHEHAANDVEGIASHLQQHYGGAAGTAGESGDDQGGDNLHEF